MKFLKVPKRKGEEIRKILIANGLLSTDYSVLSDGDFLLLPVQLESDVLPAALRECELVTRRGKKQTRNHGTFEELLSGFLTKGELESLVTSFDILGDIAIIEIPDSLIGKEQLIGDALLKVHKNVRAVFKKLSAMEGEFRVRKLGLIAGTGGSETLYKESGVQMKFDAAKVYFSVRLANERTRIASLVRSGERVLVLFAGVGPFALIIAKKHPDCEVVAVEINPEAVRYLNGNILLNKLKNVKALEGDAKKLKFELKSFDRIVMPLPHSAEQFLDVAFAAAKDGGIIHFYSIVGSEQPFDEALSKASEVAMESGVSITAVNQRIVRPYSPKQVQVVLDLRISKP